MLDPRRPESSLWYGHGAHTRRTPYSTDEDVLSSPEQWLASSDNC